MIGRLKLSGRREFGVLAPTALLGAMLAANLAHAAPPPAQCVDPTIPLVLEEQRLGNLLPGTTVPAPQRIMEASGFDRFGPEFEQKLCNGGPGNYRAAWAIVTTEGEKLWRAMVDRVQGRHVEGDLPQSDDRPLYWARLTMTKVLRQWQPKFEMTAEQRDELLWQFERASRGQYDIKFPGGPKNKRVIVSGFDPFTLGNPGSIGTGIRIGNPSGATILSLDGQTKKLANGDTLHFETYILPVNYPPFDRGMQEDTLGPHFEPGPKRVDASITVSQGGGFEFWLEQWNGRFHGPSAGNDGIVYCPGPESTRLPHLHECNIYPPERWLGYASRPWQKDFPPQFTTMSLRAASMIAAKTGVGIPRPPGDQWPNPDEAFGVIWHTNYGIFPDCNVPSSFNVNVPVPVAFPPPTPPIPPAPTACSRRGGGGDYLSNESAYRNTLLRDVFGLDIPAGHIHVPVMTRFIQGNTSAITDPTFEAYRDAIVEQTRRLIFVVGENLDEGAPPVP